MRHSTAHLVVAFCSSMAVSAAPLSQLPPPSPALISPLLTPRSAETEDIESKDREAPVQKRSVGGFAYHKEDSSIISRDNEAPVQKRSVGGFAYHTGDSSMISKRTNDINNINKDVTKTQNEASNENSDSDSDSDSSSSSDSDIEVKSTPALATRSLPSTLNQNEEENQDPADASSLEGLASIQAEDDDDGGWKSDDSFAAGSEDLDSDIESASYASNDEKFNSNNASSANNDDKTTAANNANSAQTIGEVKSESTKRSVDFIA